jgi:hypothetical protein
MPISMPALITLLVLSAGVEHAPRHPDAVSIFSCDFGRGWDGNYDEWPDNWTRRKGPDYPHFLPIAVVEDSAALKGRALKIQLDGGAGEIQSPPIPVDSRFSYVLEGRVRTAGLKHDRASLSVQFYNAQGELLETISSEPVGVQPEWKDLHVGPISPLSDSVETAVICLRVGPIETVAEDLTGSAYFDDLWFARLPRMSLHTNNAYNVYTDPQAIEVTAALSGIVERDPEIKFELLDASGGSIARSAQRLEGEIIAQKSARASDVLRGGANEPAGYAGTTSWKPPVDNFGFYRVRVSMRSPQGLMHQREVSLAVIRPLGKPVRGEFGWTIPQGDHPLSLEQLLDLLPQVGVNWLKFPVWYGESQPDRGEELMRFAERLGAKGIELVGLLDTPPSDLRDTLGVVEHSSAANIFSADPALWFPSLDPVMTRLSLRIRWWQLGGDRDTSFVGYPNLVQKIREIKKQLYRFGQEVHLGLGWSWLAETIRDERLPWEFLSLSADPPLTGEEMATYLEATAGSSVKRWVLIEPLPRSEFDNATRARDLVEQMMAAKIKSAEGIFIPNPISTEHGLLNDDATPGELLLPWRTTALVLGGSKYLGSIRMPQGSHNHIYSRGGEAVMVVWNEKPTREVLYLGEEVRQVDIWGRMAVLEQEGTQQVIRVGVLPTFLLGINEQVCRWRMAVQFQRERMPSVFGTAHRNGLYLKNFFPQGAGGKVTLHTPKVWKTYPQTMTFKMAAGEELTKPFDIELKFEASSGRNDVQIDFDINVDRRYQFSVYRDLEVGLGDVVIDVTSKLLPDGTLLVEQRMTNHLDKMVDFKCLLYAPDRRRQVNQVFRLGQGQDIKRYYLPEGKDLIGRTLWLRAEEIGGLRILNYRFVVEEQ